MSSPTVTDAGLLNRLHDLNNEEAWQEFKSVYGALIFDICRRLCLRQRLDERTAAGLAEAILLELRQKMPAFQYDRHRGTFRKWLDKVVRNKVFSFFRPDLPKAGQVPLGGTDNQELIEHLPDPNLSDLNGLSDDIVRELDADARLRRQMLMQAALDVVQERLRQPKRWEAFWAIKAEDRGPTEVASDLEKSRAWADVAAREVQRMVQHELENRLNRLLAAARNDDPCEELARYAGQSVKDLRQKGIRLMRSLEAELDRLLQGLIAVAVKGKSASATARELNMPLSDCVQASNRFGEWVEAELGDLATQEAVMAGHSKA